MHTLLNIYSKIRVIDHKEIYEDFKTNYQPDSQEIVALISQKNDVAATLK